MLRDMKARIVAFQLVLTTILVVGALFAWEGNKGFSLWDEGFLWYGAQRVMLGEVPIRDFMAYDPGRYYWSAALMSLMADNGVMALWLSIAVFQGIGLYIGIALIARVAQPQSWFFILISACTLATWMITHCKQFDFSLSIALVAALGYLVQSRHARGYFLSGLCVGLVAVFGRNHGVYGAAASIGLMVWLCIGRADGPTFAQGFAAWTAGVLVGFLPTVLMILFVKGFAGSFWDSIRFLFEIKGTNLPLPVPWPWKINLASPLSDQIRAVLVGLLFIGVVAFGLVTIIWVFWRRTQSKPVQPYLAASAFLALPYASYAYSRADIPHLALGIFPFLIGVLVTLTSLSPRLKWPLVAVLFASSLCVTSIVHPGWTCYAIEICTNVEVSGNTLALNPDATRDVQLLRRLVAEYAPDGQSFIAAPLWPGAYALFQRRAPMWEIYALFPRPRAFEEVELERIRRARPTFAVVYDFALDGRDDLRYPNTHPLIYNYVVNQFERLPDSPVPQFQLFRSRASGE